MTPLIEILIPGEGIGCKERTSEGGGEDSFIVHILILRAAWDIQMRTIKTLGSGIWQRANWKSGAKVEKKKGGGGYKNILIVKFKESATHKKSSTQYNAFRKLMRTVIPLLRHLRSILKYTDS